MHYKNGKPAKKGDIVICNGDDGVPRVGVVVQAIGGTATCNLVVAPIDTARFWVTAKDTVLAGDAIAAVLPAAPAPANNP